MTNRETDAANWLAAAGRASRGQAPNLVPDSHRNSIGMAMARRSIIGLDANEPRPTAPRRRPFAERIRAAADRRQERSMQRVRAAVILAAAQDPGLREAIGGLGASARPLIEAAKELLRRSEISVLTPVDPTLDPARTLRKELTSALEEGRTYLGEVVGMDPPDVEGTLIGGFGAVFRVAGMDLDDPNHVPFRAKADTDSRDDPHDDRKAEPAKQPDQAPEPEAENTAPLPTPFGPRRPGRR